MKIAFIHYHVKTGGVTTVLRQQVKAVHEVGEALVFTGERPQQPFPAEIELIPGLGYDSLSENSFAPGAVAESIIRTIHSRWNGGCDILHVHNPTLAKNKNLLKILKILQKNQIKLFLQIHDFAEDGRPLAYFPDEYVKDCHYGVINSRDYEILRDAGLKKEGLHKIPNTISPFDSTRKGTVPYTPVLYPIRAIRRKNVGEAVLLSLFFKRDEPLAITLPPNSPLDIRSYEGWKTFVKEKRLNVLFDVGLAHEFSDLVLASPFLITTSITEGFGFSYLEPWTAEKFLWGRKLSDICMDFEKNNINLDHLYTRLRVPIEWIGKEKLYKRFRSSLFKNSAHFNLPIDEKESMAFFAKTTGNQTIDFGLLDEAFQKKVISNVLEGSAYRDRLIRLNPFLEFPGKVSNNEALIQNNKSAVLKNYNEHMYKERLMDVYANVVKATVRQSIDKNRLLSRFLNPKTFSLLKWGDYLEA